MLFGTKVQKLELRESLTEHDVFVAGYVLNQFQATFVRVLTVIHSRLKEGASVLDMLDIIGETDSYAVFRTPGDGVKARLVLVTLLKQVQSGKLDVEDVLETVTRLIRQASRTVASYGTVVDATECKRSSAPVADDRGYFTVRVACSQDKPPACEIGRFWSDNSSALKQLAVSSLKGNIPEAARKIVEEESPYGMRCWVTLSDAIIATEARPGAEVVTTNARDFVPIGVVLGRGVKTY